VVALFGSFIAAELVFGFIELDKAADKEIELAVVVVVEPNRARCPPGSRNSSFFRDVSECAVAVVAVENAAAVLRDVEVGKSVAVVIANGDAHAVATGGDAGLFGDVSERAIAIILVEGVAQRRVGREEITFATVDEVDIHPAVVVEVKES